MLSVFQHTAASQQSTCSCPGIQFFTDIPIDLLAHEYLRCWSAWQTASELRFKEQQMSLRNTLFFKKNFFWWNSALDYVCHTAKPRYENPAPEALYRLVNIYNFVSKLMMPTFLSNSAHRYSKKVCGLLRNDDYNVTRRGGCNLKYARN